MFLKFSPRARPSLPARLTEGQIFARMVLFFACMGSAFIGHAKAAELVMYERPGCPWCLRWHKDVGNIYPKTPEGERAPLRAVVLTPQSQSAYRLREPVFYTPTFVLVEKGEEIGRITGYMGDDAFWSLMKLLAEKLDKKDQAGK